MAEKCAASSGTMSRETNRKRTGNQGRLVPVVAYLPGSSARIIIACVECRILMATYYHAGHIQTLSSILLLLCQISINIGRLARAQGYTNNGDSSMSLVSSVRDQVPAAHTLCSSHIAQLYLQDTIQGCKGSPRS